MTACIIPIHTGFEGIFLIKQTLVDLMRVKYNKKAIIISTYVAIINIKPTDVVIIENMKPTGVEIMIFINTTYVWIMG